MNYDVVVATLNRPESLAKCLLLLEQQTVKPRRVIVVDASDNHDAVKSQTMVGRDTRIEWQFLRSDVRNSAYQRNLGLGHVESEIVLMPDDDSMLYSETAAALLEAYESDVDKVVAGVSGTAATAPPFGGGATQISGARAIKDRIEPFRIAIEDRIVSKPFGTYPHSLWKNRQIPTWIDGRRFVLVEFIGGYLLSLRAEVAKRLRFDEVLGYGIGYALHEDMEFSMRAQQQGYLLVAASDASIFHDVHPSKRAGGYNYGFCWIANYIYACRRTMPPSSPSFSQDLPRFMRYKLRLYRLRAVARRDEYSRAVLEGAKTAWTKRHCLVDSALDDVSTAYKSLCDMHLKR